MKREKDAPLTDTASIPSASPVFRSEWGDERVNPSMWVAELPLFWCASLCAPQLRHSQHRCAVSV
jgi:hypothetical protein